MFTSVATVCLEFQKNNSCIHETASRTRCQKQKLNVKHLAIKCKAIKEIEKGLSNKDASLKYGVPKNTISTWVKNKDKHLRAVEARGTGKVKTLRESDFDKLDHFVFRWFISKRSQNILIDGMLIKEKALSYAKELGYVDFNASNRWLDRWKHRAGSR